MDCKTILSDYNIRKKGKVKLDKIEHNGHRWVSFEEAYKKLTWPNQRKCLKMINNWIKDKSKNK